MKAQTSAFFFWVGLKVPAKSKMLKRKIFLNIYIQSDLFLKVKNRKEGKYKK